MKRNLLQLTVLILLCLFNLTVSGQKPHITLSQLLSLFNQPRSIVLSKIKSTAYRYGGVDDGFDIFAISSALENSKLYFGFKTGKLNAISWTENLIYAKGMLIDVANSNFTFKDQQTIIWRYIDADRGLLLNVFDHSASGFITITIGHSENTSVKSKSKHQKLDSEKWRQSRPKAIMQRRTESSDSTAKY